jgi:predicted PurR-regulated permease PerM
LLAFVVSIAALYFAKEIFVPLALAVLFAFLLTPLVTGLERLRLGRIPSVTLVLIVSFSLIGAVGWIVANQLIEVINELPNYTSNIREKMESLHGPHGGSLAKATDSVQQLKSYLRLRQTNRRHLFRCGPPERRHGRPRLPFPLVSVRFRWRS